MVRILVRFFRYGTWYGPKFRKIEKIKGLFQISIKMKISVRNFEPDRTKNWSGPDLKKNKKLILIRMTLAERKKSCHDSDREIISKSQLNSNFTLSSRWISVNQLETLVPVFISISLILSEFCENPYHVPYQKKNRTKIRSGPEFGPDFNIV